MSTHSIAPLSGVPKARAIAGKLMLTIEESSDVMNVPTATMPRMAQGFTRAREGAAEASVMVFPLSRSVAIPLRRGGRPRSALGGHGTKRATFRRRVAFDHGQLLRRTAR